MPDTCERCGVEGRATFDAGIAVVTLRYCRGCSHSLAVEEEAARYGAELDALLERAGIDRRLALWTSHTYPDDETGREAKRQAREWLTGYLAGERRNLIMFGGVGTGKTGLAWALVRALCEEEARRRCLPERSGLPSCHATLVVWRDLLGAMREAIGSDEPPLLARAYAIPVLALDDLGAERQTDWSRDELAQLIEERRRRELPLIVTTNYQPTKLGSRIGHDDLVIGARIVSRLAEGAVQIRVDGTDRRLAV